MQVKYLTIKQKMSFLVALVGQGSVAAAVSQKNNNKNAVNAVSQTNSSTITITILAVISGILFAAILIVAIRHVIKKRRKSRDEESEVYDNRTMNSSVIDEQLFDRKF